MEHYERAARRGRARTRLPGSPGIARGDAGRSAVGFAAWTRRAGPPAAAAGHIDRRCGLPHGTVRQSYERRREEWELARDLAGRTCASATQAALADDHVRIVGQERSIAADPGRARRATVEFLAGKFTNAELYDWMSGVLDGRLPLLPPAGDRDGAARRRTSSPSSGRSHRRRSSRPTTGSRRRRRGRSERRPAPTGAASPARRGCCRTSTSSTSTPSRPTSASCS